MSLTMVGGNLTNTGSWPETAAVLPKSPLQGNMAQEPLCRMCC